MEAIPHDARCNKGRPRKGWRAELDVTSNGSNGSEVEGWLDQSLAAIQEKSLDAQVPQTEPSIPWETVISPEILEAAAEIAAIPMLLDSRDGDWNVLFVVLEMDRARRDKLWTRLFRLLTQYSNPTFCSSSCRIASL